VDAVQCAVTGGRPKGFFEVRDLARHHTVAAIEKLVSIIRRRRSFKAKPYASSAAREAPSRCSSSGRALKAHLRATFSSAAVRAP
jgi:hypothetical protein